MTIITKDDLALAARSNDEAVDDGKMLREWADERGVSLDDLHYVAEQRALRLVIQLPSLRSVPMAYLTALALDGMAVGIVAAQNVERGVVA